ncbi:MAG TPA: hypothetical protein VE129_16715 [Thermoanaerobaculia bacterium]|nr:hypothetical protein [Thermoanaerobaculia bacterium]
MPSSNRTPVQYVLDLQLEKAFEVPFVVDRSTFSLVGSVFSVLDTEQSLTSGGAVEAQATTKKPVTCQGPRKHQIGVRLAL